MFNEFEYLFALTLRIYVSELLFKHNSALFQYSNSHQFGICTSCEQDINEVLLYMYV